MLEQFINADKHIFSLINGHNDGILDFVMYWASNKWVWIPFYAWLLYMLIKLYKKNIFWILIIVALMIVISDQASVLIKNNVERLRPCHDPALAATVHLINNECGGTFGFVSSHAANSMALVFFAGMLLPYGFRWMWYELVGYLLIVGYSRIYLGAHFPGDIFGGWMLGLIVGFGGLGVFRQLVRKKQTA